MADQLLSRLSAKAQLALLYEVSLSPKPGLVDRINNGSHSDMDFYTFMASTASLSPFFTDYLILGSTHNGSLPELFQKVRTCGQLAEYEMLQGTHGVNTHKGANFSFALLLGALGYWSQTGDLEKFSKKNTTEVFSLIKDMTVDLVMNDFKHIKEKKELSYGEKLFLNYGFTGIRGEASSGYPTLENILLPFWRKEKNNYPDLESLFLAGLLLLMGHTEDGNLIHRGGIESFKQVKKEAQEMFNSHFSPEELKEKMAEYDQLLIKRHLSPGGAADLLALGIFIMLLEGEIN